MAWMEGKLQPIDLLSALQMSRQGGGEDTSNFARMMKQEALKQEQLKSLLAQSEYEQQTGVPNITMPGSALDHWSGANHQVPISDIPGMVSGQRQSDYGKQVHEGLMQSGRLMASMGEAAASDNARVGAAEARGGNEKPTMPNAWRGYGEYPIAALLASQSTGKGTPPVPYQNVPVPAQGYDPNAVDAAHSYQANNQGTPFNSPSDVKNVADINKANATMLKGQAQAAEKAKREAAKIASAQAKESSKVQDVATRQSRVRELAKTLSGDPLTDKQILADMAHISKVTVSELINSEMYRNLMKK